ncbi:hypothetical protein CAI21_17040 [Alkalilimnicola ehrlichii]|uniref:Methyltransferase FkbM domain-containing protein n=1 Tax=Alkalilimnicola ehrlichii TaxID=351052 RepID=A0A3E0WNA3_9GAMM|nr:FkbM family methyltransferase [Alkalilimnicola ehrlichii]RFA26393.1 hypothetical protein CAI21_17040 [Alkalilimnicola ehrlichii]RFA33456.1 hypothetical protein CAL65_17525 [Alkalilimnicola ehrlichii]
MGSTGRFYAKRFAARLPSRWQQRLQVYRCGRQIDRNIFVTDEPEFAWLDALLRPGDWVLDIGSNIGMYTLRCASLVGPTGRVFALEPVPATFSLLSANVQRAACTNVTLLNVAASDRPALHGMAVPDSASGLKNYYTAHLEGDIPEFQVTCLPVDSLALAQRVRLVKLDVEGHDYSVLRGMRRLLERDRPLLIVEVSSSQTRHFLSELGYREDSLPGSPNGVFYSADEVLPWHGAAPVANPVASPARLPEIEV